MRIRQSRNYNEFVTDLHNRPITPRDERTLKKLRRSMGKYGFLPFPLLVLPVGGKKRILDGQHRFEIAKELGLPILYVETTREDIDIAEVADGQTPWTLHHFIASKTSQGLQHYKELERFVEETGLPVQKAASLLFGEAAHSGNVNEALRSGEFRIKDAGYARRVASIVAVVRRFVPWATHTLSIGALSRFCRVDEFDDAQMIKRIETHPHLLRRCPTLEMFSEMYEALYNHMSRAKFPLAFMAREVMANRQAVGDRRKAAN